MDSKIQYILVAKGITGIANIDYTLDDNADGKGVVIGSWNEAKLGLKPDDARLANLDVDPNFVLSLTKKAWSEVRAKRNKLLRKSDWTQIGDSQLTPSMQASWLTHRQELRDITTSPNPDRLTWPIEPIEPKETV